MITSGKLTKTKQKTGRNIHLIPEVTERSKRILTQAQNEANNAFSVYENTVEFFKFKTSGIPCTCFSNTNEAEAEFSLKDFIMESRLEIKPQDFCPICFSSKFVGGYNKVNHDTIVLSASTSFKLTKIDLIKDSPFWFKPTNKIGTVSWQVNIPKYFKSAQIYIKWKSKEPNHYRFLVNGSLYSGLDNFKGMNIDLSMEMKDSSNIDAGLYAVFIVFEISDTPVYADMPRHTQSFTGDSNIVDEVESNITINFNNVTPSTRDLVIDKYGLLWRIIQVERNNPFGIEVTNNCQARLVKRFELTFMLWSETLKLNYTPEYTLL